MQIADEKNPGAMAGINRPHERVEPERKLPCQYARAAVQVSRFEGVGFTATALPVPLPTGEVYGRGLPAESPMPVPYSLVVLWVDSRCPCASKKIDTESAQTSLPPASSPTTGMKDAGRTRASA